MMKRLTLFLLLLTAPFIVSAQMVTNGDPAIVGAHGLTSLVANDVSTGTTVNLLGKTSATGALKATTSDTSIPTFIVIGGAGTSGSAQFLIAGQGACVMDASNASGASGWYVLASTTTNGRCHAQSSAPTGWIIGRLIDDATTSGSTANILASGTFNISGAGSGTVTSIATTSPIGGGTITGSGTITCTTCVTSAASLTDKSIVIGSGGGQGTQTVAGLTTDGVSQYVAGVAGSSVGSLKMTNATSGSVTLQPVTGALGSAVLSLPAATDTLVGKATTDVFTNKSIDAEGTGNVITVPFKIYQQAAACNNATAGVNLDLPTSNAPTANCLTGSNSQQGTLDYGDSANSSAQWEYRLPSDWNGNLDITLEWLVTASGGSNAVKWTVATGCSAAAATYDTAFNTAQTITTNVGSNNNVTESTQTSLTLTGCSAGNILHLKIGRDTTDTFTGTARLYGFELTMRRAI